MNVEIPRAASYPRGWKSREGAGKPALYTSCQSEEGWCKMVEVKEVVAEGKVSSMLLRGFW